MGKFTVYLEVIKNKTDVLLFPQQHTLSRIVSLLRSAISDIVPHRTTPSLRGRLTNLKKVSLPLCRMLPLGYLNLLLCCLLLALTPHLVF